MRVPRALVVVAVLLGAAAATPALSFNLDTARTMLQVCDAVAQPPDAAVAQINQLGGTETRFYDGASFAGQSPDFFSASAKVAVTKFLRNGKTVYVVAFRGTEVNNPESLNTDLNFKYTTLNPDRPDVKVHTGFLKTANLGIEALRPYLDQIRNDPNSEVIFTGHSLGGAAASIATAQLVEAGVPPDRVSAYTFGTPAVGNLAFQRRYQNLNVWRIDRPNDPIPKLLDNTIMGFRHIGQEAILTPAGLAFQPPERKGILARIIDGIKTLLGIFGIGRRANELDLNEHRREGYEALLQGVPAATGLTAGQLAEAPIVTQPPQAVPPITGRLPTA